MALPPFATARRASGFTLLEVMVALSVLMVALLGFGSLLVVNARSYDIASEGTVAVHVLRQTAEKMRSAAFDDIVNSFLGYSFVVTDINAVCTVTLFLNETDTSPDAQKLGLPRDLDGDGQASTTNVSASYRLLPAKISVAWTNQRGAQSEELYLLFAQEVN